MKWLISILFFVLPLTSFASLDANYNTGDDASYSGGYGATSNIYAQTYTTITGGTLDSIKLLGTKCSSGDIEISIRPTTAGIPSNSAGELYSETYTCSSLSTGSVWHTFTFSTPPTVVTGTKYAIVVITTSADFTWRGDSTSPAYSDGQFCYDNSAPRDGEAWVACINTDELLFETYTSTGGGGGGGSATTSEEYLQECYDTNGTSTCALIQIGGNITLILLIFLVLALYLIIEHIYYRLFPSKMRI